MSLRLRPYQETALEEIRKLYAAGERRVLLHLATGGGKTLLFCTMLRLTAEKGTACLMAVRGVKLIEQASQRLAREGVEHGIIQGSKTKNSHLPVRVCSIDTLYRRQFAPDADFIVIDEAHLTGGAAYKWFLEQYPNARILAVSATPHLKKGMRHVADAVVYPISIKELMSQGFLVKPRYFSVAKPNLDSVKVKDGEFDEGQLAEVMKEAAIKGNPVEHYRKLADGRTALMFAVNVEHSKLLVDRFNREGVPAEHIDAKSSESQRNEAIGRLERGEIKVLSNVGVLTTGFDCPPVTALILCRPTLSYNLHIQIIGRGTRPYQDKKDFIVLDHSGNVMRHGIIEMEEPCNLDGSTPSAKGMTKECPRCSAVISNFAESCPECGYVFQKEQKETASPVRKHEEVEGDLFEIDTNQEEWQLETDRLVFVAREKGLKKGWIFFKLKEKYGDDIATKAWNKVKVLPSWPVKQRSFGS